MTSVPSDNGFHGSSAPVSTSHSTAPSRTSSTPYVLAPDTTSRSDTSTRGSRMVRVRHRSSPVVMSSADTSGPSSTSSVPDCEPSSADS